MSRDDQRLDTIPAHHPPSMLDVANEEVATHGARGVVLLVIDEASMPLHVGEQLEREVIRVRRMGSSVLAQPYGPEALVVIAWLPPVLEERLATALVDWRDRRKIGGESVRTGLIGCAPAGSTHDAERALAAGFDDIMIGHISVRELAGRVRAMMRRLAPQARQGRSRIGFAGLTIERDTHSVWYGGKRITLTRTELDVMTNLVAAGGQIRTRIEILESVRSGAEHEVSERAVDNVILRLRRKLGDGNIIETVRGVGFRLAASSVEVTRLAR